jgi:hypothetical protein
LRGFTRIWGRPLPRRYIILGILGVGLCLILLVSQASGSIGGSQTRWFPPNQGGFADSEFTIVSASDFDNGTILYHIDGSGKVSGALNGSYTFTGILIETRDGQVLYHLNDTFNAIVAGRSGVLLIKEEGNGSISTRTFSSIFNIVNSTDGLQGLRGQGKLSGTQNPLTLQTSLFRSHKYKTTSRGLTNMLLCLCLRIHMRTAIKIPTPQTKLLRVAMTKLRLRLPV